MKLLLITATYPTPTRPHQGAFNHGLIQALAERHSVRVIAPVPWIQKLSHWNKPWSAPTSLSTKANSLQVFHPTFRYPPRILRRWHDIFLWRSIAGLIEQQRQWRADIVLGYWLHPDGAVAVRAARLLNVPCVLMSGGSDLRLLAAVEPLRTAIAEVLLSADRIVVVSNELAHHAHRLGVPDGRLDVIYRGVDQDCFRPLDAAAARKRCKLDRSDVVILWVGRMEEVKNPQLFVRAATAWRERWGNRFRAVMIGDGSARSSVARLCTQLGLGECIEMISSVSQPQLAHYYNAANAVVLTSHSEGIPNVLLEAMACGTPFVATNVGGVPEIAEAGIDRLVPVGDIDALQREVASVCENEMVPRQRSPLSLKESSLLVENSLHTAFRDWHSSPRRRVMFISYAFPPTGGGGVQRSAKFVKHLPQHGWEPTVLTVKNPSVPSEDWDLAADISQATTILRAHTWEPSYKLKKSLIVDPNMRVSRWRAMVRKAGMALLQPDPQVLWNSSAFRIAANQLCAQTHDAIYVSGPPFSSFLLGCRLKRRFRLPLILDFRDEWLLASQHLDNHQRSSWETWLQKSMIRRVLRRADAIIATTDWSAQQLQEQVIHAKSQAKVYRIYNGFDPADLLGLKPLERDNTKLRIVYTGTLWNLTDIGCLAEACRQLGKFKPTLAAQVELVVVGRRSPQQDAILNQLADGPITVVRTGYLPHQQSLAIASGADLLVILLADREGAERVVPAKLFEYMALRRPILAICPPSELERLLHTHAVDCSIFRPADSSLLAEFLAGRVQNSSSDTPTELSPDLTEGPIGQFARPALAKELSQVLSQFVATV